eukprot:m.257642 g.257642  ORF g.257642 m.257642 type:complete len:102 (+) comp20991_c0_seq1:583-888(+)
MFLKALLKRDNILYVSMTNTPFSRMDRRSFFATLEEDERAVFAAKLVFIPAAWHLDDEPGKWVQYVPKELPVDVCVGTHRNYYTVCEHWQGTGISRQLLLP